MSRIGKKPVDVPKTVKVNFAEGTFTAESSLGKLTAKIPSAIGVEIKDGKILFSLKDAEKGNLWGTSRTIVDNMIKGLVTKYSKTLTVVGTGYKAEVKPAEGKLILSVGFSTPAVYKYPAFVTIEVDKQNNIKVSGVDKAAVGEISSEIRKIAPPEPYQGKGIRYVGEYVRKKAGKAQVTAGAAGTGGK